MEEVDKENTHSIQLSRMKSEFGHPSTPLAVKNSLPSVSTTPVLKPTIAETTALDSDFVLSTAMYQKLYEYQKDGVRWLWKLHKNMHGGILGDDMGLGKTLQTTAFLSGLFFGKHIKTALIVCPLSLMPQWESELKKWIPRTKVVCYHGTASQRAVALRNILMFGGICITTYGTVAKSVDKLTPDKFTWDYVICDEGHKIKNVHIGVSKQLRLLKVRHRILLTGTPIQNNLNELWALFDFVCADKLLGDARAFSLEFEAPILAAQEKNASEEKRELGARKSAALMHLLEPHLLRREKKTVLMGEKKQVEAEFCKKLDLIVWIPMSKPQVRLYETFLSSEDVRRILNKSMYPLAALTVLKKICDHPQLLHNEMKMCASLGISLEDVLNGYSIEQQSQKLSVLKSILLNLRSEGHRTLVFTQSRKMLDIIHTMLKDEDFKLCRIDGNMTKAADRQSRIDAFNSDPSFDVFLLTTGVGGVGLTLTGADRVVIYDPSWNPATDSQAIDRIYRIGQTKNVVVYRMVTCGSIEEKVYRKQVFKQGIMRATIENSNPYRYFTRSELSELFKLDSPDSSSTQLQLAGLGDPVAQFNRPGLPVIVDQDGAAQKLENVQELDESALQHVEFLQTLDLFGLSDHGLVMSMQDSGEKPEAPSNVHQLAEQVAKKLLNAPRNAPRNVTKGVKAKRPPRPSIIQLMDDMTVEEDCTMEQLDYALDIAQQLDEGSQAVDVDDDFDEQILFRQPPTVDVNTKVTTETRKTVTTIADSPEEEEEEETEVIHRKGNRRNFVIESDDEDTEIQADDLPDDALSAYNPLTDALTFTPVTPAHISPPLPISIASTVRKQPAKEEEVEEEEEDDETPVIIRRTSSTNRRIIDSDSDSDEKTKPQSPEEAEERSRKSLRKSFLTLSARALAEEDGFECLDEEPVNWDLNSHLDITQSDSPVGKEEEGEEEIDQTVIYETDQHVEKAEQEEEAMDSLTEAVDDLTLEGRPSIATTVAYSGSPRQSLASTVQYYSPRESLASTAAFESRKSELFAESEPALNDSIPFTPPADTLPLQYLDTECDMEVEEQEGFVEDGAVTVCLEHARIDVPSEYTSEPLQYTCRRCRCALDRDQKLSYNAWVQAGNEAMDANEALSSFLEALQICSDDVALHLRVQQLFLSLSSQ